LIQRRNAEVAACPRFTAGEFVEEADLAEHGPDPAHLEMHPLDRLVTAGRIDRQSLPVFSASIAGSHRFEQGQRLTARTVGVEDRRNLTVRIQREEFRRVLVVLLKSTRCTSYGSPISST
jgi:hypothetical protein